MKTIKQVVKYSFEIKKSKFIAYALPLTDAEAVKDYVYQFRNHYQDARHVVYAYVCDAQCGFDDDHEPSKTAGYSMLEVLKYKQVNHVLVVCIRYFGGIKLGSGGLIRAYAQSCSEVLNQAQLGDELPAHMLKLKMQLADVEQVNHILDQFLTQKLTTSWDVCCYMDVLVSDEDLKIVSQRLNAIDFNIIMQSIPNGCIIKVDKENYD